MDLVSASMWELVEELEQRVVGSVVVFDDAREGSPGNAQPATLEGEGGVGVGLGSKRGSKSANFYFFSGSAPGGSADCTSWPFLPL
jgi:hypothetical protein